MTLSEEQKELIRSLFKTGTHGVKWDSFIGGHTYYVNSLEELEDAFNDEDLRMIVCYELNPYSSIQELLSASEKHGPYVITSNNKHYHLITSIRTLDTEKGGSIIRIILDSYYKGALSFKELLNSYRWQDGTYCGRQGNDVFRWSCFSGVITMNV